MDSCKALILQVSLSCTKQCSCYPPNESYTDKAVAYGVFRSAAALAYVITISICSSIIQYQSALHLSINLGGGEGQELQDVTIPIQSAKLITLLTEFKIIGKCLASLDCLEGMTPERQAKVRCSFVQSVQDCFSKHLTRAVLCEVLN